MLLPGLLSDPRPPPLLCLVLCPQVTRLRLSVRVLVLLLETLCCVHRRGFHLPGLDGPSLTLRTMSDLFLPLGGCLLGSWVSLVWSQACLEEGSQLVNSASHAPPCSWLHSAWPVPARAAARSSSSHVPLLPSMKPSEGVSSVLDPRLCPCLWFEPCLS